MTGDPAEDGLVVARITVERTLHQDGGDVVWSEATDGDGNTLGLVETLGLLEMAKDTAIRSAMGAESEGDGPS